MYKQRMNSKLNDTLIAQVKKHNCLYDVSIPEYRDLVKKYNAWKEIAALLNVNVEVCKKRWKTLRDTHKKYIRHTRLKSSSSTIKTFRWAESMSFIKFGYRVREPTQATSFDFNDRLIEEVKKNERLYNPSIPGYRRASRRARAWKRVSEALNANAELCKKRWKTLRDAHKKHMRIESDNLSGEFNKKYKYDEAMAFLNNITECKLDADSIILDSDSEDDELFEEMEIKNTYKANPSINSTEVDISNVDDSISSPYTMSTKSEEYDSKEHSDEELNNAETETIETIESCDIQICNNVPAAPPNVKTPTLELFESLAYKITSSGLSEEQIDAIELRVLSTVHEKIAYYSHRNK